MAPQATEILHAGILWGEGILDEILSYSEKGFV